MSVTATFDTLFTVFCFASNEFIVYEKLFYGFERNAFLFVQGLRQQKNSGINIKAQYPPLSPTNDDAEHMELRTCLFRDRLHWAIHIALLDRTLKFD